MDCCIIFILLNLPWTWTYWLKVSFNHCRNMQDLSQALCRHSISNVWEGTARFQLFTAITSSYTSSNTKMYVSEAYELLLYKPFPTCSISFELRSAVTWTGDPVIEYIHTLKVLLSCWYEYKLEGHTKIVSKNNVKNFY